MRRGPGLVMNIAGSWVLFALAVCERGGAGERADGLRCTCTAEVITHVTTRHWRHQLIFPNKRWRYKSDVSPSIYSWAQFSLYQTLLVLSCGGWENGGGCLIYAVNGVIGLELAHTNDEKNNKFKQVFIWKGIYSYNIHML